MAANKNLVTYIVYTITILALSLGLIILGTTGKAESEQSSHSGPEYYIGSFIVFPSVGIFSAAFIITAYKYGDTTIGRVAKVFSVLCHLLGFLACIPGLVFIIRFGIHNCNDEAARSDNCSYNSNINTNYTIAVLSLVFVLFLMVSTCCICCVLLNQGKDIQSEIEISDISVEYNTRMHQRQDTQLQSQVRDMERQIQALRKQNRKLKQLQREVQQIRRNQENQGPRPELNPTRADDQWDMEMEHQIQALREQNRKLKQQIRRNQENQGPHPELNPTRADDQMDMEHQIQALCEQLRKLEARINKNQNKASSSAKQDNSNTNSLPILRQLQWEVQQIRSNQENQGRRLNRTRTVADDQQPSSSQELPSAPPYQDTHLPPSYESAVYGHR